jgi:hypothetical protein
MAITATFCVMLYSTPVPPAPGQSDERCSRLLARVGTPEHSFQNPQNGRTKRFVDPAHVKTGTPVTPPLLGLHSRDSRGVIEVDVGAARDDDDRDG